MIVVKVGTSTLTGGGKSLSKKRMLALAEPICALLDGGARIALVSSGAIAAGREALGFQHPASERTMAAKQMLSAVGQVRLMQAWAELFALFDRTVAQVLLTRGELASRAGYLNARDTLQALLAHGIVPVINENDALATEEIRVGDNDALSALVANLIGADTLILLTDIDGLYDADPRTDSSARLIPEVATLDESIFALAGGSGSAQGTAGCARSSRPRASPDRAARLRLSRRGSGRECCRRFCEERAWARESPRRSDAGRAGRAGCSPRRLREASRWTPARRRGWRAGGRACFPSA